jgi:two-component system, cell cycle response regulator
MTAAFVAAGAAMGTLAVIFLLVLVVRRARSGAEHRAAEQVRELTAALEHARAESRRIRTFGGLGGSLELDDVIALVLEAASALPGAQASLVTLRTQAGERMVAAVGLSPEEAEGQPVPAASDAHARSILVSYDYDEGARGTPVRCGVAVPLSGEEDLEGTLAVFNRKPGFTFDEATIAELEALAMRAGPAIENARRFREARELADVDALTGLHNRRYFHETLAREVARAKRYGRTLALILLDLDDFKSVNDRIGHLGGDEVLAEIGERMRSVVRSADVACRIGGEEFAVLLPESNLADAEQLYERLAVAVANGPIGDAGRLSLSGGITALRSDDDRTSVFERADDALYRAKADGKGRAHVADGPAQRETESFAAGAGLRPAGGSLRQETVEGPSAEPAPHTPERQSAQARRGPTGEPGVPP